jgi:F-type H+-transporting ATPase subunit b
MPTIEIIPDFRQLIIQLISLTFLFLIFKRYGWQPTKALLEKRRVLVEAQFKAAEIKEEEAVRLKEQYEQRMAQVEEEALQMIETSRIQGRRTYEEILAKAHEEAEKRLSQASLAIEEDRKAAHAKIKEEIIDVAVDGVKRVIKKEIDEEVHRQLFDDFIAKVGATDEL